MNTNNFINPENNEEKEIKNSLDNEKAKVKSSKNNVSKKNKLNLKKITSFFTKLKKKGIKIKIGTKRKKTNIFKKFTHSFEKLRYSPTEVSMAFRVLIISIAAFIEVMGLELFIHPAHLYSGGLRSTQQIIYYALQQVAPASAKWLEGSWVSYIIFFAMNIPLAYFGWKSIGKKFTILTMYFLCVQSLYSYLIHLDPHWLEGVFDRLGDNHEYVAAVMGGLIYSMGVGLVFISGASSGGTKFVIAYISHKKKMSIGKVTIYVAIVMISIGIVVNRIIIEHESATHAIFSKITFASFLLITIHAFMSNWLVPKTKKTVITVQTSQIEKIKKIITGTIMEERLWYTLKIKKNFEKNNSSIVVLTIDKKEESYVLYKLHKALPKSLITSHTVNIKQKGFKISDFD